jgi:hypothetical protein
MPAIAGSGASVTLNGTFALQGNSPQSIGHLLLSPIAGNPLNEKIDLWLTPQKSAAPFKNYEVEMTKKMHVIIVSDDFKTFLHIHPKFSPDGHFTISQKFPAPGRYFLFSDGLPNDLNHQVFRFEMNVGTPTHRVPTVSPTGKAVYVGPYEVDLSSTNLTAGGMDMIDVLVLKDGQPAKDLHPYLGAAAHAVFLNTKDLSYVHVHPMTPGQMSMGKPMYDKYGRMLMPELPENSSISGEMMLHVTVQEAGTYKLWLQFRGSGDQLYIAEFAINAK